MSANLPEGKEGKITMDDRKQRILMAIVSLYSSDGEPVGSNLLSKHFDMAVSSATLRNEMVTLTKLGLLEQPHTSAGRVPTAKGYRYYVDNLLEISGRLSPGERKKIDAFFENADFDPRKLARASARAFSDYLGLSVIATTPRAQDMGIAHFTVLQVGQNTLAVLAVTAAGGVITRVARLGFKLHPTDAQEISDVLNEHLRFVAEADINQQLINSVLMAFSTKPGNYIPVIQAALAIISEVGTASIYFEGEEYLFRWPELEGHLKSILQLVNDSERINRITRPRNMLHTIVSFGDEEAEISIPGLCIVSRSYLAGNGLSGTIGVVGPARMNFKNLIPRLEYFCDVLGGYYSAIP